VLWLLSAILAHVEPVDDVSLWLAAVERPRVVQPMRNQIRFEQQTTHLTCNVTGHPTPLRVMDKERGRVGTIFAHQRSRPRACHITRVGVGLRDLPVLGGEHRRVSNSHRKTFYPGLRYIRQKHFSVTCVRLVWNCWQSYGWGHNPLHQFPCSKSITSWRGQKSIVSVVSCRFPNSITMTCCQQVDNFPVYWEVMEKHM